tara:strand:- start:380 stop:619 length:240 start_codon:yes stop_codon:yes gene_type:complete
MSSEKRIVNVLDSNSDFNENLRSALGLIHLVRNVFSPSKGYELLKELSLGSLRDKDLRILLTQYYEMDIPWIHLEYADG